MENNPFGGVFSEIFGNKNPIEELDRKMQAKDAEIERLKNMILRCPNEGFAAGLRKFWQKNSAYLSRIFPLWSMTVALFPRRWL